MGTLRSLLLSRNFRWGEVKARKRGVGWKGGGGAIGKAEVCEEKGEVRGGGGMT